MAKKKAGRRAKPKPSARTRDVRKLLNDGVALQVELLGAAVQIWSSMFESMAAYSKVSSEELLKFSVRGDANAALDKIIEAGREKLDRLTQLPEDIGKGFAEKVRVRAKG